MGYCQFICLILAVVIALLPILLDRIPAITGFIPANHLGTAWGMTEDQIPDLSGKVMLVTGANVGLGFNTALHLAKNNAEVIMACRNMKKGGAAMKKIKAELPNAKLYLIHLDLGSLKSVREFAQKVNTKFTHLDSLILNAGIMAHPYALSTDGLQLQFAVNHLGHFYLTKLLLDLVVSSEPSTIVSLTSTGHRVAEEPLFMKPKDLNDKEKYDPGQHYSQSKLYNILFVNGLVSHLKEKNIHNVYVNNVHPGYVNTNLMRTFDTVIGETGLKLFNVVSNAIAWSSKDASLTTVYCAVSPEIFDQKITNKYFVPIARQTTTSPLAQKEGLDKELWNISEKYVKQFEKGESLTDESLNQ